MGMGWSVVEAGPAHLNHHVMGMKNESTRLVSSQYTPWYLVCCEIQKRYLKSIFLVEKNSPPKTDPLMCLAAHVDRAIGWTNPYMGNGWVAPAKTRSTCAAKCGYQKSTEVLFWSRMLGGLSCDLSTLPSHPHSPKMFFPHKIRAS